MSMEVNRQELKARARERLRGVPPRLLEDHAGLSPADLRRDRRSRSGGGGPHRAPSASPGYLRPLSFPAGHPVHHSDAPWLPVVALRTYRQQPTGYGALIDGFSMAGRVILMNVVIFFSALGWAVAFALPYSLVLFLLSGLVSSGVGMLFFSLLAMGGAFLGSLWIGYRYAMAPLSAHRPPGAGSIRRGPGERSHDERLEVGVLQAGPVLPGLALINALLSLAVTLVFALPMLPTLMEAGTDLAQLLVTPSLALPWTAVLLSSLIQLPLSLWLTPYQTVTFSGFYQARVMQSTQVPPVWERSDPYDVS